MIKNRKKWEEFEKNYIKNEKLSLDEKFKIYEKLYKEACEVGIFPLKNPLEDIEIDIKIAKFCCRRGNEDKKSNNKCK